METTPPANAAMGTTSQGGHFQNASRPNAAMPNARSAGACMAVVHTGSYSAAASRPTTAALTPVNAARKFATGPKAVPEGQYSDQHRRKDGRKIAPRAKSPIFQSPGGSPMTVPRYAEKVNSGPGIACAAPYPAMNSSLVTHPGVTTSDWSSGSTTCPPPNTIEPLR